jgi:hypothetical protein
LFRFRKRHQRFRETFETPETDETHETCETRRFVQNRDLCSAVRTRERNSAEQTSAFLSAFHKSSRYRSRF